MAPLSRLVRWFIADKAAWRAACVPLLACALSGIFGLIIFPPIGRGELAYVSFVPLLLALPKLRGPFLLYGAMACGIPFHYLSLFWLNTLVVFHPLIPAGVLLLAAILTLYWLPALAAIQVIQDRWRGWLVPWGIAAAWAGAEQLRCVTDLAFPWNLVGHSQATGLLQISAQWAEKGGVALVSFLVLLSNSLIAHAIIRVREGRSIPGYEGQRRTALGVMDSLWALVGLFFFVVTAIGLRSKVERNMPFRVSQEGGRRLTVGLVQTNVSQVEKMRVYERGTAADLEELDIRCFDNAVQLARRAVTESSSTARLVILPESLFPHPLFVFNKPLHEALEKVARELHADLIFGADGWMAPQDYAALRTRGRVIRTPSEPLPTQAFPQPDISFDDRGSTVIKSPNLAEYAQLINAYAVQSTGGLVPRAYSKLRLVPFGEQAPILDWFPGLTQRVVLIRTLQRGTEFNQFDVDGVRVGPMVCFESSFGELGRGHALAGARVLAVITNDAWYDPAYARDAGGFWGWFLSQPGIQQLALAGPQQHVSQSVFRAIETRLPVVRAANRGRSAVIDATGRVVSALGFGNEGVLTATLDAPVPKLTAYTRRGDVFAWACFALVVLTLVGNRVWPRGTRTKQAA